MRLWRKKYRKLLAILAFVVAPTISLAILNWLTYLEPVRKAQNFVDSFTMLLLAWAGLAALWAAREAFDQKQVAQKDIGYQLRPYLRIIFNKNLDKDYIFKIENKGNGLALDIKFKEVKFFDSNLKGNVNFRIENRPLLSALNGTSKVGFKEIKEFGSTFNGLNRLDVHSYLIQAIDKHFRIIATYKNLKNDLFKVVFISDSSYNDKFKIESQKIIKRG